MKNLFACFFALVLSVGAWAQSHDVTFNVNTENITVGPNGMYLGGGDYFGDAMGHPMSDDDGDGVYTVTISVPEGYSGNYIYLNSPADGGDWGAKEDLAGQECADGTWNDRLLPTVDGPATYSSCFAQCSTDGSCLAPDPTSNVTFKVDMSDYPLSFGTVNLNGSFNGWCGGCAVMTDDDADGVYELTIALDQSATYEYKFTLDGWNVQENFTDGDACTSTIDGYVNRTLDVATDDIVLDVVCFDSCEACTGDVADNIMVTWQVDMTDVGANPAGVFIAGGFQGWDGGASQMTDAGNGVYTYTQEVLANSYLEWKYLNGPGWGFEESVPGACANSSTNRFFQAGTEDATIDLVCFGECFGCDVEVVEYEVTFNVNMANETVAESGVYLAGGGNFGNPGQNEMTDPDGDGIYSITMMLDEGFSSFYTFTNGACGDWSCKENLDGLECGDPANYNDRFLPSITGPTTISTCFGQCSTDGTCEAVDLSPLTLTVDVCDATPSEVRMTGPWWGWDPNGGPIATDNGDGTWSVVLDPGPTENMEYLWVVDGVQENLIQAMVDGGTCAPVTDYANYANRLWEVGSGDASSVYGTCGSCEDLVVEPTIVTVDFAIDMNTTGFPNADYDNIVINGSWNGWAGWGVTLADADGDGIFTGSLDLEEGTTFEFVIAATGAADELSGWGSIFNAPTECEANPGQPIGQGGGNYIHTAMEGSVVAYCAGSCEATCPIPGCTDPFYAEFDLAATADDGSCMTPVVFGCIYEAADNYNSEANTDDGSCEFTLNACPGDLDGDGLVATPDLLQFLSVFGTACE